MQNLDIFKKYHDFFESLINQKKDIVKLDLKSRLFLIREISALDFILKNTEMKTINYVFQWKIEKIEDEIIKVVMLSKSHFQSNFQHNTFYMIFSEEFKFILIIGYIKSKFLDKRLTSFIKYFYPQLSLTFLSQSEIKNLLLEYIRIPDCDIQLNMMIYRSSTKSSKPIRRAVDFIGGDLITKITELEYKKRYLDTIGLTIRENDIEFRFRYNRYNKIIWFRGNVEYFIQMLNKIYYIVSTKFKFLDNRERKNTINHKSKPIILKFSSSIFSTEEDIKSFRDKINTFPSIQYAVMSSGNPFMHIIIRDENDDSTFSLKTLNNSDLMICPQIIGSNTSFLRILDLISNGVSEYEIEDLEAYLKSFYDEYELVTKF